MNDKGPKPASTAKIIKKTQAEKEAEREEKKKILHAAELVKLKRARIKKLPSAPPPQVLLYLRQSNVDGSKSFTVSGPGPMLRIITPTLGVGQICSFRTGAIIHDLPVVRSVEEEDTATKKGKNKKGEIQKPPLGETNHIFIKVQEAVVGQRLKVTVTCALPFTLGEVVQQSS